MRLSWAALLSAVGMGCAMQPEFEPSECGYPEAREPMRVGRVSGPVRLAGRAASRRDAPDRAAAR